MLILKKRFAIKPEKLFQLISSPDYMIKWFSPNPDIQLKIQRYEFSVGSNYEYCYTLEDGAERSVYGQFCDIQKNVRIAFTWTWRQPDIHAGIDSLVTWDLNEIEQGTEFVVTHEKIELADMRQRHYTGWVGTMERLQNLIKSLEE